MPFVLMRSLLFFWDVFFSLWSSWAFLYLWSRVLFLQILMRIRRDKVFLLRYSFLWGFSLYCSTIFGHRGFHFGSSVISLMDVSLCKMLSVFYICAFYYFDSYMNLDAFIFSGIFWISWTREHAFSSAETIVSNYVFDIAFNRRFLLG